MIYCIDLDGTLTEPYSFDVANTTFAEVEQILSDCKPNYNMINKVNLLYNVGHEIMIYTARSDYFKNVTLNWLAKYSVKYGDILFNKPYYDYIVDDKNLIL